LKKTIDRPAVKIRIIPVRGGFIVKERDDSLHDRIVFPKFQHALNCARARKAYRNATILVCDKLGLTVRTII